MNLRPEEISSIIRKRLFSNIKENKKKKIVDLFVDYAEKNSIIPVESEKKEYRKTFRATHPENVKEYNRVHRENNPELYRKYRRDNKSKEENNITSWVPVQFETAIP